MACPLDHLLYWYNLHLVSPFDVVDGMAQLWSVDSYSKGRLGETVNEWSLGHFDGWSLKLANDRFWIVISQARTGKKWIISLKDNFWN